jgi:hypothetical protein
VVGGTLAGFAAWLGMLNVGSGMRRKLDRLPLVIALATVALVLGLPLGPQLQAKVTVDPHLGKLQVVRIERSLQRRPMHRVITRD